MLKSIKVRDYMTRRLVTFRTDMDLFTAIHRLLEHRISGAPVVDDSGALLGLLSEGDCLRAILSGAYYESVGGRVGDYMTRTVETVSPETDIIEVSQRFLDGRRRRLPVVEAGRLVGQISRHDVLRAVKEFAQHDQGQLSAGEGR
ncbi:MAG: CBS domain-containing protein [Gammaproteobacteria bacterium]|uniref:CBS domain-containing protein n=1 Tax=Pseudomonas cuatrocienegasensis TaxID=543360 RepID=A0ABY1BCY7_9PSED|nr:MULTISPECIES: CBS domain-containing protein [Pseudomonas]MBU1331334.1 CBS domain-containing protein [Gammaproteobacteria bacterium]MBU1490036.1 CBS domain-containing protein [Gammaproteobacteria bacterium]MBU2064280.1 CBS domain-containing protein [Gammaproteobacteria bacterium]MBU2137916.1 CBS domain-containing protein [Gammaproteobacteria bacterium]MBU2218139.1 CBS domain-containing protein [Gammaproteobacteria bacterium]